MAQTSSPLIFDRALKRRQIARARINFAQHSVLFTESADQMIDRLQDVKRDFASRLDLSPFAFLPGAISTDMLALDEEYLPFAPHSFDLIVSNLALHWVNDVPGCLAQIRGMLKPEGMFAASLIGENSLHELRACLSEAEMTVTGGISPRLSPTIDMQSASALLQRAGFTLPVVDKETVTLIYPDMFALMRELRGMGQTNAHRERLKTPTRRAVFFEAARLYAERFGNEKGHIPASFDLIHLHGWT